MWLLHESATIKQQIPKLSSANMADLDAVRKPLPKEYQTAKAFHLAPQSPSGHWLSLKSLEQSIPKPLISMDIQADTSIDISQYRDLSFCSHISAFLPSREEVQQIWQTDDLAGWMNTTATEGTCCIAVKMGEQGSLVLDPATRKIFKVPAYPTNTTDTTGAGDAYCGGFLAGLILSKNVVECAAMGTVSASFIVESYGALDVPLPINTERSDRFKNVISKAIEMYD